MKEERKGTRGASKRAARAQRVPEANSRGSSNGLHREHHTSRQETPHTRKDWAQNARHRKGKVLEKNMLAVGNLRYRREKRSNEAKKKGETLKREG